MTDSLNSYLDIIAPHLVPALVCEENLSDIGSIARFFPGQITSFFGFECRLGEKASLADFLLCIKAIDGGREILAGYQSELNVPEAFFDRPIWRRIRNFCRHWADPTSPLYEKVDNIWLEFDVDGSSSEVPLPSLFFGSQDISSKNHRQYQWVTQTALKLFLDRPIGDIIEQKLFDCFNLLPAGAWVFQIGVMLARQSDKIRICVRGIDADLICNYLTHVEWLGEIEELRARISELSRYVDRIDLDLDVSDRIEPKIGLECYLDNSVENQSRWQLFLDYLVVSGLCIPQKRDALLAYRGLSHERAQSDLWPSHLLNLSSLLDRRAISAIARDIHHVKIVYQSDCPLQAKAYLSVNPTWLSVALLKQQKRELQNASI
jgi:hypothetical protein